MKIKVSSLKLRFHSAGKHRRVRSIHHESGRRFRFRFFSRLVFSDNPEVSSRLTNLSMRHARTRPVWFDLETLTLPGRSYQCKTLFWQIVSSHQEYHKSLIALIASTGMGKTSFLAELHTLLERAPGCILTLAPGAPQKDIPYKAIRNILEQRFYISNDAHPSDIHRFISGAVSSIIAPDQAEFIIRNLLLLWTDKEQPHFSTDILTVSDNDDQPTYPGVFPKRPETSHQITFSGRDSAQYQSLFSALLQLFSADLTHNPIVIILDDIELYDLPSIILLRDLYDALPERPFTLFVTAQKFDAHSPILSAPDLCRIELEALSDSDLSLLTRHFAEAMFKPEPLELPEEINFLIAQRAYGNPKRAIQLIQKYIHTDGFNNWSDTAEQLRHELPPEYLGLSIVQRFKDCTETERIILQSASQLDAPFTASTIESIILSWPDLTLGSPVDCGLVLKNLRDEHFLEKSAPVFGPNANAYVFKHECVRLIIAESVSPHIREYIGGIAAQWYTLNNPNHRYDENIGDFWVRHGSASEASHYYVRVAYYHYRYTNYAKAWPIFRKLIHCISENNSLARRIQYMLDGADVAFHLGQIDEAFILCRRASHHALSLSAYPQAARANIQISSMLLEIGNIRHMERYLKRAQVLLNREDMPENKFTLYIQYVRKELWYHRASRASGWLKKAQNLVLRYSLSTPFKLLIKLLDAQIAIQLKPPSIAIQKLKDIIDIATQNHEMMICANAHEVLGNLYELTGDIASALESWNIALGLAQKMNHVILHAKLLADIADGAFALKAYKTARTASEQCLQIAQQTHQKLLIARCMQHTSQLHYQNGQLNKALRLLKKAHKSALALRNIQYWVKTLSLLAFYNEHPNSSGYHPDKADSIYQKLIRLLDHHDMPIHKVNVLLQYSDYLKTQHRIPEVLDYSINAGIICQNLGLDKAYNKFKQGFDELLTSKPDT